MPSVPFRDFDGEVAHAELVDGPAGPIRSTTCGRRLLCYPSADGTPAYARIHAADADAFNELLARAFPVGLLGPAGLDRSRSTGEPDSTRSEPPDPARHDPARTTRPAARPAGDPGRPAQRPAGAHPKAQTADLPPLSLTAVRLLKRLEHLHAFDERSAAKQAKLVKGICHVRGTRSRNALNDLISRGLIDTRRRLGTWLTPAGRAAAKRLVKKRKKVAT